MSESKTLCPLPWVHQATYTNGSILLCCVAENDSQQNLNKTGLREAFNSPYWNGVRRQMIEGQKPSSCKRCWIEEGNGYRSHRLTEIDVWERRMGKAGLQQMYERTAVDGSIELFPTALDLRIGNTCNLQCVMCRPHDSVKWLGLSQTLHSQASHKTLKEDMLYKKSIQLGEYNWQNNDAIWDELREIAPSLQELIIGGGEPMLLRGHIEFIQYCVDQGFAKDIHLRYHTNLTVLNPQHFELWKHFKIVEFFASIDGLGEKNNYVRYPAQWSDIEKNLNYLDDLPFENIKIMILFSSHFLSLYNLDELAQWIEDRKFKKVTHGFNGYLHPGIVMQPEYLSPQAYPQHIKDKVTHRLLEFEKRSKKPSYKVAGVVKYMNERDRSELMPATIEYIKLLDQNRGTQFAKVYGDLYKDLESYF